MMYRTLKRLSNFTRHARLQVPFVSNKDQIMRIARANELIVSERLNTPRASARNVLAGGAQVAVPLEGLIDFAQERERLGRERDKLQKEATKLEAQLANPNFAERAPVEKVNEAKARLQDIAVRTTSLAATMEIFQ